VAAQRFEQHEMNEVEENPGAWSEVLTALQLLKDTGSGVLG
jgi:hypothetical protein